MGQNSRVEWCHHTQNFWTGCAKVSAECKNCYAVTAPPVRIARSRGLELWGEKARRLIASEKMWAEPARWNALAKASGERHRVFTNSLADFFEDYRGPDAEEVGAARTRAFATMVQADQLDWLVLTKRPEDVLRVVPGHWLHQPGCARQGRCSCDAAALWPRNVWIGTTAGTQATADLRIPYLRKIPAPVRFVSAEPLLEEVSWDRFVYDCIYCRSNAPDRLHPETGRCMYCEGSAQCGIDWLIVGGESGPGARPFDLSWARGALRLCAEQKVPFFMKQLGARAYDSALPRNLKDRKGGDMSEWPEDLRVRQIPNPKEIPRDF